MIEETLIAEIEGYAARYGEADLNGDVIAPGAFTKTLRSRTAPVRMLYQHASEKPIGRWMELRSTRDGLIARGELLLSSQRAREVYALLKGGALDGLSIGYRTIRSGAARNGRRILEAELWEVSIVTFPMAPRARLTRIGEAIPASSSSDPSRIFGPPPSRNAGRLLAGPTPRSGREGAPVLNRTTSHPRRAFNSPQLSARHFASALRDAASILSVQGVNE